eukprot:UN12868
MFLHLYLVIVLSLRMHHIVLRSCKYCSFALLLFDLPSLRNDCGHFNRRHCFFHHHAKRRQHRSHLRLHLRFLRHQRHDCRHFGRRLASQLGARLDRNRWLKSHFRPPYQFDTSKAFSFLR